MDEKQFTKGFNDGYSIEVNKPGFVDTMIKGISNAGGNDYVEGLMEGHKQRQNELERERIKDSIQQERSQDKNKEQGRSR